MLIIMSIIWQRVRLYLNAMNNNSCLLTNPPTVAVVIPAYRVEKQIGWVLDNIPDFVSTVIVVNDASPDNAQMVIEERAQKDTRIVPLRHEKNQGVGGAMLTGFREALRREVEIVVKVDGDGQMDPADILTLIQPLLEGEADFCKGNRFQDLKALRQMPKIRLMGNVAASLLAKTATGYWNMFDPANGFFALRAFVLRRLDFNAIARDYLFETSLLSELYHIRAVVRDVSIPARYADENSSISYSRMVIQYPSALLGYAFKRIGLHYFVYDFNLATVYVLLGLPLLLFGVIFGAVKWIHFAGIQLPAPTGTVVLASLSILIGIHLLTQAVSYDLQAVPKQPISPKWE